MIQDVSPFLLSCCCWAFLTPKRNNPVPLNAGILVIGSLLWDKDRQRWRDERLGRAIPATLL